MARLVVQYLAMSSDENSLKSIKMCQSTLNVLPKTVKILPNRRNFKNLVTLNSRKEQYMIVPEKLPVTRFDPGSSEIGSYCSANCATATAQVPVGDAPNYNIF